LVDAGVPFSGPGEALRWLRSEGQSLRPSGLLYLFNLADDVPEGAMYSLEGGKLVPDRFIGVLHGYPARFPDGVPGFFAGRHLVLYGKSICQIAAAGGDPFRRAGCVLRSRQAYRAWTGFQVEYLQQVQGEAALGGAGPASAMLDRAAALVTLIGAWAREQGIPCTIALVPGPLQLAPGADETLQQALLARLKDEHVHDLTPLFQRHEEELFFPETGAFSATGNQVLAEALLPLFADLQP
jgi:hypothetical protein